jgi:hypothetical protein
MNTKQLAIITKNKVDTTFEGVQAYLHAEILPIDDDPMKGIRRFKVRTDLVDYIETNVGIDEEGNTITENRLTVLEVKQPWAVQVLTYAEIDALAEQVEQLIPKTLSRTQRDTLETKIMFLEKRKQDAPWGIDANQWRLREDADLVQDDTVSEN